MHQRHVLSGIHCPHLFCLPLATGLLCGRKGVVSKVPQGDAGQPFHYSTLLTQDRDFNFTSRSPQRQDHGTFDPIILYSHCYILPIILFSPRLATPPWSREFVSLGGGPFLLLCYLLCFPLSLPSSPILWCLDLVMLRCLGLPPGCSIKFTSLSRYYYRCHYCLSSSACDVTSQIPIKSSQVKSSAHAYNYTSYWKRLEIQFECNRGWGSRVKSEEMNDAW